MALLATATVGLVAALNQPIDAQNASGSKPQHAAVQQKDNATVVLKDGFIDFQFRPLPLDARAVFAKLNDKAETSEKDLQKTFSVNMGKERTMKIYVCKRGLYIADSGKDDKEGEITCAMPSRDIITLTPRSYYKTDSQLFIATKSNLLYVGISDFDKNPKSTLTIVYPPGLDLRGDIVVTPLGKDKFVVTSTLGKAKLTFTTNPCDLTEAKNEK